MEKHPVWLIALVALGGCGAKRGGGTPLDTDGAEAASNEEGESGTTTGASAVADASGGSDGGMTRGSGNGSTGATADSSAGTAVTSAGTGATRSCIAADPGETVPCTEDAPAGAFDAVEEWAVLLDSPHAFVTPVVANMTDDNDDGAIDLCDVPDVLVSSYDRLDLTTGAPVEARLSLLDGATGAVHWSNAGLGGDVTPALADIDNDGVVDIVTVTAGALTAYAADGTEKWVGAAWDFPRSALGVADFDTDGDVEIYGGATVWDHRGVQVWSESNDLAGSSFAGSATTAADLDGDGRLDLVLGQRAYSGDGVLMWSDATEPGGGFPHVADLDGDGRPEVLVTRHTGVTVYEHDGTAKFRDATPTGDPAGPLEGCINPCPEVDNWIRPAAILDFDGDGDPEFALSTAGHLSVFSAVANVAWTIDIQDETGISGASGFRFTGNAGAQVVYADERMLGVFDGEGGTQRVGVPRTSRTLSEYPPVVDVDNDGSAEIVVVSGDSLAGDPGSGFTVKVIGDREDRWVAAGRIWNQHTFHVTNVAEDGSVPARETPHWTALNSFRAGAQLDPSGSYCSP